LRCLELRLELSGRCTINWTTAEDLVHEVQYTEQEV
jgi:hypothetical protein